MSPTAESNATLVVVDPNGRRARVPLFPFPFRIGRAPDNNLVLRDSRISRNHAQVSNDDGHCVLEDLGSRHGVWVNGERVMNYMDKERKDAVDTVKFTWKDANSNLTGGYQEWGFGMRAWQNPTPAMDVYYDDIAISETRIGPVK